jgi:translocator protein
MIGAGASPRRAWTNAALAAVSVIVVLISGQLATFPNLAPWYAGLTKPSFNPPDWVFGPVWTALYALMGFALWRLLRTRAQPARRRRAITLFYAQLALNALWSWLFFAAHSPLLGLIDIVLQLAAIVACVITFRRLDGLAALCLVPLALWVGFATLLNAAIWRLNG